MEGIEDIVQINSIEQLQANRIYSMHDFDLGYNIKILKKLGMIDSVNIIGIPMKIDKDVALEKIGDILRPLFH